MVFLMAKTPTVSRQETIRSPNRRSTRAIASKLREQGRSYVVVRNGRKVESHRPSAAKASGYPAVFSPSRAVSPGRSAAGSVPGTAGAVSLPSNRFGHYIPIPSNGPRRYGGPVHVDQGSNLFTEYFDLYNNPLYERNNMSVELFELIGTIEHMNANPQYHRDQWRSFAQNFPGLTAVAGLTAGAAALAGGSRYAQAGRAAVGMYRRSTRAPTGFNLRAGNTGRVAGGAGLRTTQPAAGRYGGRYFDPFVHLYR